MLLEWTKQDDMGNASSKDAQGKTFAQILVWKALWEENSTGSIMKSNTTLW
jgi:hypothetical protein